MISFCATGHLAPAHMEPQSQTSWLAYPPMATGISESHVSQHLFAPTHLSLKSSVLRL